MISDNWPECHLEAGEASWSFRTSAPDVGRFHQMSDLAKCQISPDVRFQIYQNVRFHQVSISPNVRFHQISDFDRSNCHEDKVQQVQTQIQVHSSLPCPYIVPTPCCQCSFLMCFFSSPSTYQSLSFNTSFMQILHVSPRRGAFSWLAQHRLTCHLRKLLFLASPSFCFFPPLTLHQCHANSPCVTQAFSQLGPCILCIAL